MKHEQIKSETRILTNEDDANHGDITIICQTFKVK